MAPCSRLNWARSISSAAPCSGYQSLAALEGSNLEEFARLMDVHWQRKKSRSAGMSNDRINEWYDHAMAHGALGGKLIGGSCDLNTLLKCLL